MPAITITAYTKAKKGMEDAVLVELENVIRESRKEKGCINYDLHYSLEDKTSLMWHENWENQEVFAAHLNSPHVAAFLAKADALLAEPLVIKQWNKVW